MASVGGGTASQAARITDRTRSMFRAILAENGVADTDDAILELKQYSGMPTSVSCSYEYGTINY
jgi:hypothetical protein